jgi:hypothetical protein
VKALERYLDWAYGSGEWWRWFLFVQLPFLAFFCAVAGLLLGRLL